MTLLTSKSDIKVLRQRLASLERQRLATIAAGNMPHRITAAMRQVEKLIAKATLSAS